MRDESTLLKVEPYGSEEIQFEDDDINARCAYTAEELEIAKAAPDKAVTSKPPMLGYVSTVLIIINRICGTGVFRTATTLAGARLSSAWTLGLWAIGGTWAVCGAFVFAELGLTIPRLEFPDEGEQSVPRNGGELNYLIYFAKKYDLLAACLYGIPFVITGCVAANTIAFAQAVLGANNDNPSDWTVRAIAIAIAAFCCSLHAIWRRAGLVVNNVFGLIKIGLLLTMFACGLAYVGGAFDGNGRTASNNLSPPDSLKGSSTSAFLYAQSWLAVIFAFGGFHQANYVLAEVKDCRRRFKKTSITTVAATAVLFFLVQVAYLLVVPREEAQSVTDVWKKTDTYVDSIFFKKLFKEDGRKVQSAFIAFSSLGNIIVQTFTAARVKQEIAKTGILPFSTIIARNYRLLPKALQSKAIKGSEDTPAAAFLLHFVFSVILILASKPAGSESYRILVNLYSFVTNALFGFLVGFGLLMLRLNRRSNWSQISSSNKWVSLITTTIYMLGSLFPMVGIWIPPEGKDASLEISKYWFVAGTLGVSCVALGFVWWVCIQYIIPELFGKELETDREYNFIKDNGSWVVWHEVVSIRWRSS